MNILLRSFRYVIRKWKKSSIIFLIVLVTSTMITSGLAILNAQEKESETLRGATGTSFTVSRDISTGGWVQEEDGSYSTQEFISEDMMDQISKLDGVKGYNGSSTTLPTLYNDKGDYLAGFEGTGYKDLDAVSYSAGCTNTLYHPLFLSNSFVLTSGKHISIDDKEKIIISEDLAKRNNLTIGDTIYAINDPDSNDPKVKLEITGIFAINADKSDEKNNYNDASYYDYSQYTFVDFSSMKEMTKNYIDGGLIDSAEFFVDDPKQLDRVLNDVKGIDSINWNNFKITVNNEIYELTQDSMNDMSGLIQNMILIVALLSTLIIILVLSMWVRARKREIGIFLSIGKSKFSILLQFIFEVFIVSFVAFPLSYPVSQILSKQLGQMLGKELNSIVVIPQYFIIVSTIGSCLLLIAVIVSSITLFKEQPKKILSEME